MQSNRKNLNLKAKIFKALSDPIRLQILEFLHDGEKCVCEITPHVKLVQPMVSRHLKILKSCGLVKERKDGNRRLYSITDKRALEITAALDRELVEILSKRMIEQITT